MVFRIVIVLIGLWLVLRLVKRVLASARGKGSGPTRQVDNMIPCSHCGTHVPEPQALWDDHKKPYCCEEHRNIARR